MDIATIIGLVLGIGFTIWGIMSSGSLIDYYDFPSIVITLGGTVASVFISYSLSDIAKMGKVFQKTVLYKIDSANEIIADIINLANVARKEGLLSLEEYASKLDDEFLKKGIMLIVDGTDPELVRNILETELVFLEERHSQGQGILESMGSAAPAFGMLGTLIGLVNMLQKMDDPKAIGPNMSVALITTFYGSFLANVIFIPLALKLKLKSKSEVLIKELMIEGLLSIQAGENPRIIEEKLKTFIPPEMRTKVKNQGEKEVA
ncbi:MotA/TolQ/ExbB proton channel family protein [Tissierella pigra]|uniref:Motility protein A n=1 Tax=Tissierella pigra TaxID=2607614 RepID=A0A6N7XUM5_9FIRM|nr:MotA/TolQ/ExbB proton channel family protein [Tissierella pigra]MBU5426537.1 MotA/TolQ/ExbB proton channel family protein [Tissierella pigra]MSU00018.1 motility protein A [Tissierella pigra]